MPYWGTKVPSPPASWQGSKGAWKRHYHETKNRRVEVENAERAASEYKDHGPPPLDLFTDLSPELYEIAETLWARFGRGLLYVGPQRR